MRPKQIAITIVSTTILTLYTIRFMFWVLELGIGSNHIIPYSIAFALISGLVWKVILPNKELFDIAFQEGFTFPFFILIVSGWSTVHGNEGFSQSLSHYVAFMIGLTISWVLMNVIQEGVIQLFARDSKPKRQHES